LLTYARLLATIDSEDIQTFQVPGEGGWVGEISYFIPNRLQLQGIIQEYFLIRIPVAEEENIENSYE